MNKFTSALLLLIIMTGCSFSESQLSDEEKKHKKEYEIWVDSLEEGETKDYFENKSFEEWLKNVPDLSNLEKIMEDQSIVIYDKNGNILNY